MFAKTMKMLEIPECIIFGRLLGDGLPGKRGRPRIKEVDQTKWVIGEEAAKEMNITYQAMFYLIEKKLLRATTHMGRLYVSRESIEEYNQRGLNPFVSESGIAFIPFREIRSSDIPKNGSKKIFIKLTERKGQKAYELGNAARALCTSTKIILEFAEANDVKVACTGTKIFLERESFRKALVEKGHIKPE